MFKLLTVFINYFYETFTNSGDKRVVICSKSSRLLLTTLKEGQNIEGTIRHFTDYGAFIDLGGMKGLLHITNIAWRPIKHPAEVLNIGDDIKVKVLRLDHERNRISLGLKQLID